MLRGCSSTKQRSCQTISSNCGAGMKRARRFCASRVDRMGFATADIVGIPGVEGASQAGQAALPAADQRPQQIGMRGVVTPGELAIERKFGLYSVELLLAHH